MTRLFVAFIVGLLTSSPARCEVSGRVVDPGGSGIPGALVEDLATGSVAVTDGDGTFSLEEAQAPARLRITKQGFLEREVEVPGGSPLPQIIRLELLEAPGGEITVTAGVVRHTLAPATLAVSTLQVEDSAPGTSSVAEIAAESAAVSQNGQGGLFQVLSIRGVSRQRVRSLIDGMRIVGERRAGVSASFLDPFLLESIEVVRGPSSSFYGSGALGGVLQLVPRTYSASAATLGYASEGDEIFASFGWGDTETGWSLGLAHRRAGESETPREDRLNTGYRQTSASVSRLWRQEKGQGEGRSIRLRILSSWGTDIGKSNSDFPEERTVYPRERHLMASLSVVEDGGWQLNANLHPNDLQTLDLPGDGSSSLVENRALDFGLGLRREWEPHDGVEARWGLETFSRRGVTAEEARILAGGERQTFKTLDGGSLDEVGAYGALRFPLRRASFEAGGRLTWQQQSNEATDLSRDDTAGSVFLGLRLPLRKTVEVVANAGTGLRFPSLSERFFSGTTGRGRVVGAADLDAERSFNSDLGFRWFGQRHFVAVYVFRNEIEDYIERVQVSPGLRTFRNLTRGTLEGVEVDALYHLSRTWRLSLQGHRLRGRSGAGEALADVPPHRLSVGLRGHKGVWGWKGHWQIRWAKEDPAGGEQPLGGGHLVSASIQRDLSNRLTVQADVTNLLDERILLSADDLATEAPGRSLGLRLAWRG